LNPISESYALTFNYENYPVLSLNPISESYTLSVEIPNEYKISLNPISESYALTFNYENYPVLSLNPISESYTLSAEIPTEYKISLNPISESHKLSVSKVTHHRISMNPIPESINISATYFLPYSCSISYIKSLWDVPQISGYKYIEGVSGSTTPAGHLKMGPGYIKHGKGDNDIHYVTLAERNYLWKLEYTSGSHPRGSEAEFNSYKKELTYYNRSIGNHEIISGSRLIVSASSGKLSADITVIDPDSKDIRGKKNRIIQQLSYIDFNDHRNFSNKEIIKKNPENGEAYDVQYKSYINGGDGIQTGKPMGMTSYYSASSDGTLYYPINHWINFHTVRNQLHNLFYGQTGEVVRIKNIDGTEADITLGLGHFSNDIDYEPTKIVYSRDVTGTSTTGIRIDRKSKK
jgi:hypothetical protein